MALHRLTWRVGMPFVLLVALTTVALAVLMSRQIAGQETERFASVATTSGVFVDSNSLPAGEGLARSLERVTGHVVVFRIGGRLEPRPPLHTAAIPLTTVAADRVPVTFGEHEVVAVPINATTEMLFVREVRNPLLDPLVLQVLGAYVLVALLTAWLVGRRLVRPLRHLASQLPRIETPGPIDLPEADRPDEIGDLARAFLRTRQALHDEQAARERMEKLAVLGRMTAALAHEVQNPVAAIRIHAQLWRGSGDDCTAQTIEREAARIESLLNQWMYLTRPEPPVLADVDVGALLARLVEMHRHQADHAAVAVVLETAPGLIAPADGRRLDQVFRNLLTNALQAMPGGGTLRITATAGAVGGGDGVDGVDGTSLRVVFADTGRGFSAAALARFAEFFYSEKEGGMGIGLSVASEIVKAHGGRLLVANRDGGGAVVTVELPAGTVAPTPARPPAAASGPRPGEVRA